MNVLVVGGSGSGKSAYAERLAARLSERRTYVATMAREGGEAKVRIERHRRQRATWDFETVECPAGTLAPVTGWPDEPDGVVLLDDLGNLASNALFDRAGQMAEPLPVLDRLSDEVLGLSGRYRHVVVVGNEVGSEGRSPYEGTRAWVELMGALCSRVAAGSDVVIEVTAGIPLPVKGTLPL